MTPAEAIPGAAPLETDADLAEAMVAGLHRFLDAQTEAARVTRERFWQRDLASPTAYARSVAPNRERFRRLIGAQDPRPPFEDLQLVATLSQPARVAESDAFRALAVRWPALPAVEGEGLLLEPKKPARANVVALPDCDWTPEMLIGLTGDLPPEAQFARRLAESGCRVVIPTLISRDDTLSGNPRIRMTNQPHREFLYRPAYELGRHLIGFEVQKTLAVVDWFARREDGLPIGVAGCGEGGLLAFYCAALDERIQAALVSGYFGPRERLWEEPIYRNVWRLLAEFGDAEIASLIAPRALLVEMADGPRVEGPPPAREGRSGAAPGRITPPAPKAVRAEAERARSLTRSPAMPEWLTVFEADGSAVEGLLQALGVSAGSPASAGQTLTDGRANFDPEARQQRQFQQLLEHTQALLRESEFRRREYWAEAAGDTPEAWAASTTAYRKRLWEEVTGRFPPPDRPPNPRARLLYDEPAFRGYEVVLDVWEEVFASGILLLPKDLRPGERRPVVVCQHGLEGRPQNCANPAEDHPAYHRFACRLAERGFITFAPQNPYIGGDRFRSLQRKANPLGKTLFSLIAGQHQRILEWLASLPQVDPARIAFYGLSYGGKTAMRVPALLTEYCLSICSADYNEWIWKNASARHRYSYLFTGEYDMPEFDLGNTFNHAEMSWLICPRPFMVERGHDDGVAPDEWVAYEYARTRERYDRLGIGERTEMEVFNGPHTIHGVGTFAFLHRHLDWPPTEEQPQMNPASRR